MINSLVQQNSTLTSYYVPSRRALVPWQFRSRRVSSEHDRCPASDVVNFTPSTARMCEVAYQNAEADTPCSSGAPAGLCSCRVVLRAATLLPSSGNGILRADDGSPNMDKQLLPSRRHDRWLVVAKAIGGELALSLFCPLRGDQGRDGEGWRKTVGHFSRAVGSEQRTRQSRFLVATWDDWEGLGYGPLQWMSHAQKHFLGSLALSWISFRHDARNSGDNVGHAKPEAFLQLRPILARVTRIVDTIATDKNSTSCSGIKGLHTGVAGEPNARRSQVTVRDNGRDFIVDVEAEEAGHAQCSGSQQRFGEEAWRETGLGELFWIDRSWRRYLAGRLSHQVSVLCGCFQYGASFLAEVLMHPGVENAFVYFHGRPRAVDFEFRWFYSVLATKLAARRLCCVSREDNVLYTLRRRHDDTALFPRNTSRALYSVTFNRTRGFRRGKRESFSSETRMKADRRQGKTTIEWVLNERLHLGFDFIYR